MNATEFRTWLLDDRPRPLVMGILNVTPDSFSDGGQFQGAEEALAQAKRMIAEGADLLDIGGESTRPGSQRVSAKEQVRRVVPVIEAIRRESDIAISIDTTRGEVARAAVSAGASILNDISAGREDPAMLTLAAKHDLPIILMHMQGEPGTMQLEPHYNDVVEEVCQFLLERLSAAVAEGCGPEMVLIDPGIGFGKTVEHNLELLRRTRTLCSLGPRLLIGTSRKRFVGAITGVEQPADRVIGSCVSAAWAVTRGASIVRAHDVKETVQVVRMAAAIVGLH